MARPKENELDVEVTCIVCKVARTVRVQKDGYMRWLDGECIQDAMPELSSDDREMLISNICTRCFDKMFDE